MNDSSCKNQSTIADETCEGEVSETRNRTLDFTLPMMPIRDMVIFPFMMTPFVVGRESSLRALEAALNVDSRIFLAAQRDPSVEEPKPEDIYPVGCICKVVQAITMDGGHRKVLAEGIERAESITVTNQDGRFSAEVRVAGSTVVADAESKNMMKLAVGLFQQYATLEKSLNPDSAIWKLESRALGELSDVIAANLRISSARKQNLLATFDPLYRLQEVIDILEAEIEGLELKRSSRR
jgi:ATP-dependent Lon protease